MRWAMARLLPARLLPARLVLQALQEQRERVKGEFFS